MAQSDLPGWRKATPAPGGHGPSVFAKAPSSDSGWVDEEDERILLRINLWITPEVAQALTKHVAALYPEELARGGTWDEAVASVVERAVEEFVFRNGDDGCPRVEEELVTLKHHIPDRFGDDPDASIDLAIDEYQIVKATNGRFAAIYCDALVADVMGSPLMETPRRLPSQNDFDTEQDGWRVMWCESYDHARQVLADWIRADYKNYPDLCGVLLAALPTERPQQPVRLVVQWPEGSLPPRPLEG